LTLHHAPVKIKFDQGSIAVRAGFPQTLRSTEDAGVTRLAEIDTQLQRTKSGNTIGPLSYGLVDDRSNRQSRP
jgi:hypothetical protein